MSESLVDFDTWPTGIASASIPANNNVRRMEILTGPVISATTTAEPGSPQERDIYIIPAGATGTSWATFDDDDIVIYYEATWTAFQPFNGLRKYVVDQGTDWQYIGDSVGSWAEAGSGGAGGAPPVVTESGTSLTADDTNAGNYTRFTSSSAKTYTFDDAETYAVSAEYHGRNANTNDLTITEAGGMTINPPAGGTLVIPPHGTFTVKIIAADEADLFGVTVPL